MTGPVFAVSMCRDEQDIIATTVRNLIGNVDEIIVADNGSVDGTRDILSDLARDLPVTVIDDPERGYYQSRKMTALAHLAGERGAEWIVPWDSDELWYCTYGWIGEHLAGIGEGMMTVTAELYDHVATGVDSGHPDPVHRLRWRREARLPLPKMACRYRHDLTIHQGNHGVDYGGVLPASVPLLVVRHFPYRSVEQFLRKVRNGAQAYRATDLPDSAGAHWRQWGQMLDEQGEDAVVAVYKTWYYRENPRTPLCIGGEMQPPLIHDPAPI